MGPGAVTVHKMDTCSPSLSLGNSQQLLVGDKRCDGRSGQGSWSKGHVLRSEGLTDKGLSSGMGWFSDWFCKE